jgi:hypothetical protein
VEYLVRGRGVVRLLPHTVSGKDPGYRTLGERASRNRLVRQRDDDREPRYQFRVGVGAEGAPTVRGAPGVSSNFEGASAPGNFFAGSWIDTTCAQRPVRSKRVCRDFTLVLSLVPARRKLGASSFPSPRSLGRSAWV